MSKTPIALAIVQDLQTALRAIAVDAGDYATVAATAVKLDPDQSMEEFVRPIGPRPLVVIEAPQTAFEYRPASQVRCVLSSSIHWLDAVDVTDDTDRLQQFCRAASDVERAITRDVTRGGRVVDTRITTVTLNEAITASQVYAEIGIEMVLHRTYGEPDEVTT